MRTRYFARTGTDGQLARAAIVVRWLVAVAASVPLALCVVRPANAQSSLSSGYPLRYHDTSNPEVQKFVARAKDQQLSPGDVSTFQANLQTLVNWLSQTATNDPNQQAKVNDLVTQLNGLTSDQMTQLASSFDVNAFNTAVTLLPKSVVKTHGDFDFSLI